MVLRSASLAVLLLYTIALIDLLQFALIRLPNRQASSGLESTAAIDDPISRVSSVLAKRQTDTYMTIDDAGTDLDLGEYSEGPAPTVTAIVTAYGDPTATIEAKGLISQASLPSSMYVPEVETLSGDIFRQGFTGSSDAGPTIAVVIFGAATSSPETTLHSTASSAHVPSLAAMESSSKPFHCDWHAVSHAITASRFREGPGHRALLDTTQSVFLGSYLTVVLAVIYRILVLDCSLSTQLNIIEPFRQLARARGAAASRALFSSYHSNNAFERFQTLFRGRLMLCLLGATHWLICLLPALALEAI